MKRRATDLSRQKQQGPASVGLGVKFLWISTSLILLYACLNDLGSIRFNALVSAIIFTFGLITLLRSFPAGYASPAAVFFLVLSIFHLGLVPFWLFKLPIDLSRRDDYIWFQGALGVESLRMVNLALATYVAGAILYNRPRRGANVAPQHKSSTRDMGIRDRDFRELLSNFGALATVVALGWWSLKVMDAGGVSLAFASYQDFLKATDGAKLSHSYLLLSVGIGLLLIQPLNFWRKGAILIFAGFALLMFFLGLRGEILFPLGVALTVVGFRRAAPRLLMALPIALGLLTAINVVKQVRATGIVEADLKGILFNPLSGLSELGNTIRVVTYVVRWHDYDLEPFARGATYTVSIARQWERVFGDRPPASEDFRLFNSLIAERAGQIGGSIIGEAYHNFAFFGVISIALIVGLLLGFFSTLDPTPLQIAMFVAVFGPLLTHVRNSFVPVVPAILMTMVPILVMYMLRRGTRADNHSAEFRIT